MHNIVIKGDLIDGTGSVLTDDALRFLSLLEETFGRRRRGLLAQRIDRARARGAGGRFGFLPETASIRDAEWSINPPPERLTNRRVEITAAVGRRTIGDALAAGANLVIADFEDSSAPTWEHTIEGQVNLQDVVAGRLGRMGHATDDVELAVRPRGWHLAEKHLLMDGRCLSASLVDFGLYVFHNGTDLAAAGSGVYLCLPKIEHHMEARLWNDVFLFTEAYLGLPKGFIKASVLIETVPAVFQMDEILYELRDHSLGLNAGRWDYMFSMVKFRTSDPDALLTDRRHLTLDAPFLRAYDELMVSTCHRRGAHAIGGISASIRTDVDTGAGAAASLQADKRREAERGFDGTWVARPDAVDVARNAFDEVLGSAPHQMNRPAGTRAITADELLDVSIEGAGVTEAGLRMNVRVGLLYIEAWLRGKGSVALFDLMEDTATAEICRSQVWQWMRHRVQLDTGRIVTRQLVLDVVRQELDSIVASMDPEALAMARFGSARKVFERIATSGEFVPFLTDPAYELIA